MARLEFFPKNLLAAGINAESSPYVAERGEFGLESSGDQFTILSLWPEPRRG